MKNFFLIFLIIVAAGEIVTLGILKYQKSQVKALTLIPSPSSGFASNSPLPTESPSNLTADYLSALEIQEPTPQIGKITLTLPPSPTPAKLIKTATPSAMPTLRPSQTPSFTPTNTPAHTITPTPTALSQIKYSSQEINSYIDRFAGQYGVDSNVIRHIALCESGFRADAKYLNYGGLFQFSISTWQSWRRRMGEDVNAELRFNAEEAVQTAAYVISKGSLGIWPNCKP